MRKTVVALVTLIVVAGTAPGSASARHNVNHRLSALEAKVNALQRKTNALHTFTHKCLARDWVPIGVYGDFEQQNRFGYLYDNDAGGPQPPFHTSALDVAAAPDETAFIVAAVDSNCVSQIAARAATLRREASTLGRYLKRPAY